MCPHCLMKFAGCVCAQCGLCGGLTFTDEFSAVHVCASSHGELTTTPMLALPPVDGFVRVQSGEETKETRRM